MDKQKILLFAFVLLVALVYVLLPSEAPQNSDPPKNTSDSADSAAVLDDNAPSPRGNQTIHTFDSAKVKLLEIFQNHKKTFYCGCRYKGKVTDLESCKYEIRKEKNTPRAHRVEIEHVVPASGFGRSFKAWSEGHPKCLSSKGEPYKGRRCAKKASVLFRLMEADLYNLQPAIGEVNGDRSDASMALIPGEVRKYGECDVEIVKSQVEPRPEIRGDIARIYFYMEQAYPGRLKLTEQERKLFLTWNHSDPIDSWERERAHRILSLQGNPNPFIP